VPVDASIPSLLRRAASHPCAQAAIVEEFIPKVGFPGQVEKQQKGKKVLF
jgi:hypothetical protein